MEADGNQVRVQRPLGAEYGAGVPYPEWEILHH